MWFLYFLEDGLEEFATEEEAILAARCKIETYRDRGAMEWIDGVECIAVFKKVVGVKDASQVPEFADWRLECDCPPKKEFSGSNEVSRSYSAPEEPKPLLPPWEK